MSSNSVNDQSTFPEDGNMNPTMQTRHIPTCLYGTNAKSSILDAMYKIRLIIN